MRTLAGLVAVAVTGLLLAGCTNDYSRYKFPKHAASADAGDAGARDANGDAFVEAALAD